MPDINIELKKYFESKGNELVRDLQAQLRKTKKIATGHTIKSVEQEVIQKGSQTVLTILADEDIAYILGGRSKNKNVPPIKELEEWMQVKGIKPKGSKKINTRSLAWAISRGVQKKGIRGVNLKSFAKREDQNIYEETRDLIQKISEQNFAEMAATELSKSGLPVQIK